MLPFPQNSARGAGDPACACKRHRRQSTEACACMRAEFDKLRSAADYERLITEQVPRVPREWRRPIGEQCMEAPVSSTGKRCAAWSPAGCIPLIQARSGISSWGLVPALLPSLITTQADEGPPRLDALRSTPARRKSTVFLRLLC
jgi:hypothetical protein